MVEMLKEGLHLASGPLEEAAFEQHPFLPLQMTLFDLAPRQGCLIFSAPRYALPGVVSHLCFL